MFALIVIDQQKGIDHPRLGLRNNPGAEEEMLAILEYWREFDWPVFHVRHRSVDPNSVFWPEQDGFEYKSEFLPDKNREFELEKSVPCAFTNTSLASELDRAGIRDIVLVGVATNNSIESTARTGGNLGYQVFVIENACFTFAQKDYFGVPRSAEDVHAMSLANLDGEYAKVINRSALFDLLADARI